MNMKPYYEFAKKEELRNVITMVAKLDNGISAAIVDYYCVNPACSCVDVMLEFVEMDENDHLEDRIFSFSLNTTTWKVNDIIKLENKKLNYEKLIEDFLNNLDKELKEELRRRVAEAKEYGKNNPIKWFDELELDDGTCFGYSEVFGERDVEKFTFDYQETNYFVDDQYCTDPDCKCNDVLLTFIDIIPGRKTQEPLFAIRTPLGRGSYKVEFSNNIAKDEMNKIIDRFKEHISNDFGLLKNRYAQMKEFGKKRLARKGQNHDRQNVKSSKLGRNEPCHCGSGKKYKKCCGA